MVGESPIHWQPPALWLDMPGRVLMARAALQLVVVVQVVQNQLSWLNQAHHLHC
jgi:hypothetical protein